MKGRICMLHNLTIWRGGAERLLFTLANHLMESGYEVDIYVLRDDPDLCFPELRRRLKVVPTSRLTPGQMFTAMPPLQALEMARRIEGDYDVIHAHNFPSNMAALFLTRLGRAKRRVPYVWQCNEPPRLLYETRERDFYRANASGLPPFQCIRALAALKILDASSRILDKLAATNAHVVTTLSEFVAKTVKSLYGVNAVVINPGVDRESLDTATSGEVIRDRYGIGDSPLVLTISRLWPAKNIEMALKAFRILLMRVPSAFYLIVGDGPSETSLKALARSLNLQDRCIFVSDLKVGSELSPFYSACDVFLLTALGEPWGLTAMEAMSFGKPVVVSESGGLVEFIENGRTGYLVDPTNPEMTTQALSELLLNQDLAKIIGRDAASTAQQYSWKRMATAYDKIYTSLMN